MLTRQFLNHLTWWPQDLGFSDPNPRLGLNLGFDPRPKPKPKIEVLKFRCVETLCVEGSKGVSNHVVERISTSTFDPAQKRFIFSIVFLLFCRIIIVEGWISRRKLL